MIARRSVITVYAAAALLSGGPLGAQTRRRARLGFLSGGNPAGSGQQSTVGFVKDALRQLGWRDGETLDIDERYALGDGASLPRLAGELILLRPDVLVATGVTETRALLGATRTVPIVFLLVNDPVALGLVESIARPGGNVTGFTQGPALLTGKQVDLLTLMMGHRPRRIAWVGNPANSGTARAWAEAREVASGIGAELIRVDLAAADDLDRAFDALKDRDAMLVHYDFLLYSLGERIAEKAARQRLPAIYGHRSHVLAGGLMSYGPDLQDNFRQAAGYVNRILNGRHPRDLPVVEASRFELLINAMAAKALGLTVPALLIAQADEVIE